MALGILAGAVVLGLTAPYYFAELLILAGALAGAAIALWRPVAGAPPPGASLVNTVTPEVSSPSPSPSPSPVPAPPVAPPPVALRREESRPAPRPPAEPRRPDVLAVAPGIAPPRRAAVRRTGRGPQTVLAVDDQDSMLVLVNAFLTDAGYRVLEAEGGARALEVCRRFGGAIDLLLTDVRMPEMDGPELCRRVAERYPGIKVLFMSGFAREWASAEGVPEDAAIIEKGFSPQELQRQVQELLNGG